MVVFNMNLKSWKRCFHALQSIKLNRNLFEGFEDVPQTKIYFCVGPNFQGYLQRLTLRLGGNLKQSGFDSKAVFFALLISVLIVCKIQWCLAEL